MEKVLYTYALTKALLDKEGNYIDTYMPFVLGGIPSNNFVTCEEIQIKLIERFSLKIPIFVLDSILIRAIRKGYAEKQKGEYGISESGIEYRYTLEAGIGVERRINALLEEIAHFFTDRGIVIGKEQIYDIILGFINKNAEYLREWLIPISSDTTKEDPKSFQRDNYEEILFEYIKVVEHEKPESHRIIRDMVLGSIISVVLQSEKPCDINGFRTREFESCQIFLDTNYIFSMLGLNPPEFHEPAKELKELLRKNKSDLKAFPFTVDEMCKVLRRYPEDASRYPSTVRVDSLYSNLRKMGWKKSDAIEYAANIEKKLANEGIQIDWDKEINLENYTPPESEWRNLISRYKPGQGIFHQNHDLAAIEMISRIRGHTVRRIEDSKAFFLSSDGKLSRFNLIELGHKEKSTICEVLQDRLVANLLWLKNPDSDIPLKSIIAAHSKNFFIDRRLWDRFNEVLKKLAQDERINDQDISLLFYHGFIEDVLAEKDETNADEITSEFIIEEIGRATELHEGEVVSLEQELIEKDSIYLEQLRSVGKKDIELEKYLEIIDRVKKAARKSAKKSSYVYATLLSLFITLLVIFVIYAIYWLSTEIFNIVGSFISLIALLFIGSGGLYAIWKKLHSFIWNKIFNKTYKKKLHDMGLDDLSSPDPKESPTTG